MLLKAISRMNQFRAHYSTEAPVVHFRKLQSIRQIILDRPKQLNALNLDMVRLITPQLKAWQESELCKVIVITNLPQTKAFCAGGDVKSISLAIKSNNPEQLEKALDFFEEEYKLNHLISTTKKPYVSILNGITMGGGVGLSVHGHFRIVTENTMIAMPETAIGLFPDVGGSFFLPRLDGELGTFLGLTGHRLVGEEAFLAGFGTHFVPSSRLEALMSRLAELETDELDVVSACIDEFSGSLGVEKFKNWSLGGKIGDLIDRTFKHDSLEEILEALFKESSSEDTEIAQFATKQLAVLKKQSPTSMKVTLEQLRRGANMHIAECFQMEFAMVQEFLETPDFLEGTSAKLIEKREPKWNPAIESHEILTKELVRGIYFHKKDGRKELDLHNKLTYYDYPHRTLSGLPTDRDVSRVVKGEGKREDASQQPQSRKEVKEWIQRNWGRYDSGLMGAADKIPRRIALDGGRSRGKVGLQQKVDSILERHTKEIENVGLKWY